jgi:RHS repeat-associated protein
VIVNGQTLLQGAATTPFGPISAWHWGNGLFEFRDYDQDGRLATWEFRNGMSLLRKDQTFDAANRITAITDPLNAAASQAYQYDALDRLTVAQTGTPPTHTQQFAYDAIGNRLSVTLDSAATNFSYSTSSNRLQKLSGTLPAGYLLGGGTWSFSYNNANRLTAVQSGATTIATYRVNALGQRVSKNVGGVITYFVYDERGHLLGEYDQTGNLIQETIWLEDLPVATLRPTGIGNPTPIAIYYVHADHLGTPRAVTRQADNALMWQWDNLDPFGANAANENPSGQGVFTYALRFPGQYYDAETGTHYNYYRDYDPAIGRYEQSDPLGLDGGLNTFAYVAANPLRYFDKFGRDRWGIPEDPWYPGRRPPFHVRPDGNQWGWGCGDKDTDHNVPDIVNGVNLTSACRIHDKCYERACEPGVTQEKCDNEFRENIKSLCLSAGKPQTLCNALAWSYYQGVRRGGHTSFNSEKTKCCQ